MDDKIKEVMGLVIGYGDLREENYASTAFDRLEAIESKLRELVQIPEGYALVPVEPTARMLMDGSEWTESASMATGCYRAMLSEAPKETK